LGRYVRVPYGGRELQCFKLNWNKTETARNRQKITLYSLQNVWKCTVFVHLHSKFAKSGIMSYNPEKYPEKFNTGIKKRRILWCFKVNEVDFKIFYYKHYRQETMRILCVFVFFEVFCSYLLQQHFSQTSNVNAQKTVHSNVLQDIKTHFLPITIYLYLYPKKE